jgi:hypothetical protein
MGETVKVSLCCSSYILCARAHALNIASSAVFNTSLDASTLTTFLYRILKFFEFSIFLQIGMCNWHNIIVLKLQLKPWKTIRGGFVP